MVEIVKKSITGFKDVHESWKGMSVRDIWLDFVDSVKSLPKDVQNLRKVGRKILKTLEEYTDLPPVYALIKEFTLKIIALFNDIKTDVTTLYNVSTGSYLENIRCLKGLC